MSLLYSNFSFVLSRKSYDEDSTWPAYSCDLNPPDYFLWGNCKRILFEDPKKRVNSIPELKTKSVKIMKEISLNEVHRVIDSFPKHVQQCIDKQGKHFRHRS